MKNSKIWWTGLFSFLFICFLSFILWPFDSDELWFGLPAWTPYMASLHICFLILLLLFNKYFWKDE